MINVKVKNYKGKEYTGIWNGKTYSSSIDGAPELRRIYVDIIIQQAMKYHNLRKVKDLK